MDPAKIFQIITNSTLLATRLHSGRGAPLQFSESRYCLVLPEDSPSDTTVIRVFAAHRDGEAVRYSITGGNRDGLFTIDQHSGLITLAAPLDHDRQAKHELVVAARSEKGGSSAHSIVHVTVADVNDNEPEFLKEEMEATVVEGDRESHRLPLAILKVFYRYDL
ncbi:putative neural-cadherin 2 [Penaeus vannamei]|uniref:putative neural-cadherin 2 n=1 Tax=Penaeus vannamei TaxID=6689 RepID=UPI00387F707B